MRKITLLFLLCIGLQNISNAQIRDTVKISLPMFMDTTCPGTQLTFAAIESNDTFSGVTYDWYINSIFTGVIIDTFKTTATLEGDTVYCIIHFINSFGVPDMDTSNFIVVHHSAVIAPGLLISLIAGSNPDCAGHPLTFMAFPKNGGPTPAYQWMINGVPVPGADTVVFSGIFGGTDTISCQMVSNSPCLPSGTDSNIVTSNVIPVVHIKLFASVSIVDSANPICSGVRDTFVATVIDPGSGSTITWYVNSKLIAGAVGNVYITDSLHNGDLVYCTLTAPDSCVLDHVSNSNIITMTVIPRKPTSVTSIMTHGANPGCLDSIVSFSGSFLNFGMLPRYEWTVNGVPVVSGSYTFSSLFHNGDVVALRVIATDGACYTYDTLSSAPFLMLRDSTPAAPLLSLIGNVLQNNTIGRYRWYFSTTRTYNGTQIGGASGQIYHPNSLSGTGYYYSILDTANCPSYPSNIIYISLLKVKTENVGSVNIYPNPTTGILNLDWDNRTVNMKLDVYNVIGQGLIHQDILNESHHETDMAGLPEGNYLVVLRDDENGSVATYKIYLKK